MPEPLRSCPSCGRQAATYRPQCPHCGERYDARLPARARRRLLLGGALAAVLLLAAGAPIVAERRERRDQERATEHARAVEREIARLRREQRPMRGRGAPARSLAEREALVRAVEGEILRDARARVSAGELDGRIREVECGPLRRDEGARPDHEDPAVRVGRYDCVAVQADVRAAGGRTVAAFGHPFVATIRFARGTYVWCKDNKNPGERGVPLAKARLDPACLGARGTRIVGDGYAEPGSRDPQEDPR